MPNLTITFERDVDDVLNHLGSVIAKELEMAVRDLPDVDGDVSPDDYYVRDVDMVRTAGTMRVEATLVVGGGA